MSAADKAAAVEKFRQAVVGVADATFGPYTKASLLAGISLVDAEQHEDHPVPLLSDLGFSEEDKANLLSSVRSLCIDWSDEEKACFVRGTIYGLLLARERRALREAA